MYLLNMMAMIQVRQTTAGLGLAVLPDLFQRTGRPYHKTAQHRSAQRACPPEPWIDRPNYQVKALGMRFPEPLIISCGYVKLVNQPALEQAVMAVTNDRGGVIARSNPSGVESHHGTPATKLALSLCRHDVVGVHSRGEWLIIGVHKVTRGVPEGRT